MMMMMMMIITIIIVIIKDDDVHMAELRNVTRFAFCPRNIDKQTRGSNNMSTYLRHC
jgi:hypothetical protein